MLFARPLRECAHVVKSPQALFPREGALGGAARTLGGKEVALRKLEDPLLQGHFATKKHLMNSSCFRMLPMCDACSDQSCLSLL